MTSSRLYKFVADPEAAAFLLRGTVRFTPIPQLNDPSELVPALDTADVQASLERLRKEGYSDEDIVHLRQQGELLRRLAPQFQAIGVPRTAREATALVRSPFYDSTATLERLLANTAREMSSKVGLFCLSCRYDSLPMWAHYAANAAGFTVEFRDLEGVFPGDATGILRQLTVVRYDQHVGVTFEPQSHRSLFFAKFADWSYEEEMRVVLPLADCRTETVKGRMLYLYDLPASCVARVILGWNMSPANVALMRQHIEKLNPSVEVVQARFLRGRVELSAP